MKTNTLGDYNPFPAKKISYIRARTAYIEDRLKRHADKESMDYHLLKHGFIPYEKEDAEDIQKLEKKSINDEPPTFLELTSFGNWFVLHPEKICGVEVISRRRASPVLVKGSQKFVISRIKEKILRDRKLQRHQMKPQKDDNAMNGKPIPATNNEESMDLRLAKAKAEAILRLDSYN